MPFIPHTQEDINQMLADINLASINDLFSEIPNDLKTNLNNKIPKGMNELSIFKYMQSKSDLDYGVMNYIGAGAYEHHIPACVWDLVSRGEFMTAYTPYQAEASQGGLQLIYEYQTMICNLTGMDVSNASMYDGATALAEAVLMAVRANKKNKSRTVVILGTVNNSYIDTVRTIVSQQNIELFLLDYDNHNGVVDTASLNLDFDPAAVVIQQPNFFGCLEDIDNITNWAHSKNSLVIAMVNPTSLAILEAPGNWGERGADIVCGEGQPLGVPLSSGGPYFGFMACTMELIRQIPGRIVGRTTDVDGKDGFTLTLQAREQHIRRSKATSNICTNQGLLVTAAAIYMSLLGTVGLEKVAAQCVVNTNYLVDKLCAIDGISKKFSSNNFHEVVLFFDKTKNNKFDLNNILSGFNKHKISAGLNLSDLNSLHNNRLDNCLLVCVTETKDQQDLDYYVDVLKNIL